MDKGGEAVIPPRKNRKKQWNYDTGRYKMRNAIEWTFGLLKQFRRIVTRYKRKSQNYIIPMALAALTL